MAQLIPVLMLALAAALCAAAAPACSYTCSGLVQEVSAAGVAGINVTQNSPLSFTIYVPTGRGVVGASYTLQLQVIGATVYFGGNDVVGFVEVMPGPAALYTFTLSSTGVANVESSGAAMVFGSSCTVPGPASLLVVSDPQPPSSELFPLPDQLLPEATQCAPLGGQITAASCAECPACGNCNKQNTWIIVLAIVAGVAVLLLVAIAFALVCGTVVLTVADAGNGGTRYTPIMQTEGRAHGFTFGGAADRPCGQGLNFGD